MFPPFRLLAFEPAGWARITMMTMMKTETTRTEKHLMIFDVSSAQFRQNKQDSPDKGVCI